MYTDIDRMIKTKLHFAKGNVGLVTLDFHSFTLIEKLKVIDYFQTSNLQTRVRENVIH